MRAMHELAICQSLIGAVERVAAAQGGGEVTAITVAVGPLSNVEPTQLARAFTLAQAGTVAGKAQLHVEVTPVLVWCEACGLESQTTANRLNCGQCGNWRVELRSGGELLLRQIEMTDLVA
jgi:hydrogenase nickel incorporation protein HypA/HybF